VFPEILNHVKEIMITNVATTTPDQTLAEAARLMEERNIGSLAVLEKDRLVGITTERDFLKLAAKGYDSRTTKVSEGMTQPVVKCDPMTTITEAFVLMKKYRVRHLPVVEKERLVGMISLSDLVSAGRLLL
jgi:CBS domain-containing protein